MKGELIIDKVGNDGSMKGRFIKHKENSRSNIFKDLGLDIIA